jgi:hypothetical protein
LRKFELNDFVKGGVDIVQREDVELEFGSSLKETTRQTNRRQREELETSKGAKKKIKSHLKCII